jgi:hypothetical protein
LAELNRRLSTQGLSEVKIRMFRIAAKQAVAAVAMTFVFAVSCSQRADVRKLRFLENGRRYYDQRDYSRAIIEWKNAAEIANGDPEPFYWLGMGHIGASLQATGCVKTAIGTARGSSFLPLKRRTLGFTRRIWPWRGSIENSELITEN